jgi:hypothetical protein
MSLLISLKKFLNDYGFYTIAIIVVIYIFNKYLSSKSSRGREPADNMPTQYKNTNAQASSGVVASNPDGQNEVFSSANGIETSMPGLPSTCSNTSISNPAELLPKDNNNQWAQLNPSGKGDLANINLLKAGYHIGIDTIGQTLRNANLQIRSEPPNPQLYVGPWNTSTIEPDFLKVPFEIGSGPQ